MPSRRLAAVARLTDSLSRATTPEHVYACALDALQDSLGVERASVLLFDEAGVMSFVAWRGLSDTYRRAVNGHTPWTPDSSDAQPICVADVYADESLASYRPVFDAEGIRALGFFPLVYGGRVIGKFMLYYREPHACNDDEIQLAQTIATQIAFGVARTRAEAELARERDRLADLIENVPGVVWEMVGHPHEGGRVTFVSDRIREILGYSPAEWYADPRFTDDLILEKVEVAPNVRHYRMHTRDGRSVWTEVRVANREEHGRVVTRGVTIDITERKEAESRARFLGEVSRTLASSLDYDATLRRVAELAVAELADWFAIDIREDDGEFRRLAATHRDPSRATDVEELSQRGIDRHRTGFVMNVIEQATPLLVREIDWEALERSYADEPEAVALFRRCGATSFMIVPLLAGIRCFGAMTLISASRVYDEKDLELAAELGRRAGYAIDNARLYREAQEANRAKDEFLITLSHELRTPMTATLGWAAMLRRPDLSPENYRLAIETIDRSTRAQAQLIDDILDVSRIVSGKLQLSVVPVNVRGIVDAAVDAIRPSVVAKQLDLRLSLSDVPAIAVADAARLQQVLWNVLSNAVKFTPAGGTVFVSLEDPAGDEVRIVVRDSGIGIPRKFLPHIFERFRQADSSSSRAHGGLGLGLAIVKSLLDLHGGAVTADSDGEGTGSTFTITLPLAARTVTSIPAPTELHAPLALAGISVLLVEDEDDTRTMLTAALRSFGARVTAVGSVAAAIESMTCAPPTVVVSDIGMPDEDGYGLVLRIRGSDDERTRTLPAIALTAYAAPEDRARVLASGFDYHLAKPVDPLLVVKIVREATGR